MFFLSLDFGTLLVTSFYKKKFLVLSSRCCSCSSGTCFDEYSGRTAEIRQKSRQKSQKYFFLISHKKEKKVFLENKIRKGGFMEWFLFSLLVPKFPIWNKNLWNCVSPIVAGRTKQEFCCLKQKCESRSKCRPDDLPLAWLNETIRFVSVTTTTFRQTTFRLSDPSMRKKMNFDNFILKQFFPLFFSLVNCFHFWFLLFSRFRLFLKLFFEMQQIFLFFSRR